VLKRVGILIACTFLLWGAVAYPAWLLGGEQALIYSLVAFALCLIPAAATLVWAEWFARQSPQSQPVTILAGSGVRMGLVLGVALLLYTQTAYFQQRSFWFCLLLFYLFTLALEVTLAVKGRVAAEQRQGPISARSDS
jgi:hypothetical protein